MKPDWDELGEEFENSKKVIIGDVDCTTDGGKPLCEKFGVEGYPTIKYFNPPDQEGEKYEGDRSLKAMKKFAKTLGPACTVDQLNKCNKKQLADLQPYLDRPVAELETELADMKAQLAASQKVHAWPGAVHACTTLRRRPPRSPPRSSPPLHGGLVALLAPAGTR
mmetsp:Transcript_29324/g.98164  ORF Transcript_29324/g.98164 Transcript_29324/m.98164 type:complete len:165 (+) Transcript_29324:207-701(+)